MGETIRWRGTERQEQDERMKACRSRRKTYGQSHCREKDGSCDECTYDMAIALRVQPYCCEWCGEDFPREKMASLGLCKECAHVADDVSADALLPLPTTQTEGEGR